MVCSTVDSLWMTNTGNDSSLPPLTGEKKSDVVIVGGGFTGLRAALVLAEAGLQPIVLEAASVGWGASGRNGGQVNPLLPVNTPDSLIKHQPPLVVKGIVEAVLQSADELFALVEQYHIDCQPRRCGWLRLAHSQRAASLLRRDCDSWRQAGADIKWLEGTSLSDATGTEAYSSGLLMAGGGCLQPLAYCRGLARCASAKGATVYAGSEVLSLLPVDSGWVAKTSHGSVQAKQVLLCTNGYSQHLWPSLADSILPLTSIQTATAPLDEATIATILPKGHTIADTRRLIFYARREPDNRFICGSLADSETAPRDFARLQALATTIFPALQGVRWDYRWGGRLAVTNDYLPHLHELAPGVWAGLGYNGRGVAMATMMGRLLAERLLGENAPVFPVSPLRRHPWRRFMRLGLKPALRWMAWRDEQEATRHNQ